MADVAVLAQSPLAEQPDDTAHQVSHILLQTAKFLLVTQEKATERLSLFVHMQCLHSSSCCKCQSRHAIDNLCLEQAI
jgi:hypothetical protein